MTRTIADIMVTSLVTFTPDTNIHDAIHVLLEGRISGAPVVDGPGTLVGVLSKKDCLKIVLSTDYNQDRGGPVSEYIRVDVNTLESHVSIAVAAEHFIKRSYRRLPALRAGELSGQRKPSPYFNILPVVLRPDFPPCVSFSHVRPFARTHTSPK